MKRALMVAGALLAFGVAALGVRSRKLPEAPSHARVAPSLEGLPKVDVCWLEFARREAPGRVAMAGFSTKPEWHVTVSGLLVRHPRGDVLVDMGFSSHYDEEIADYPALLRFWLGQIKSEVLHSAPDAVRAAGADPAKLTWAIPSHAHIDHAGGLVDLPGVPVLLPQEEIDFFAEYGTQKTRKVIPAHARAVQGRTTAIHFEKKPYETFDESADVFGDGSIVIVKLPGHTPGSIGTFVNASVEKRFFHVGDTVNVAEAIDARRPKSLVMSGTDHDEEGANAIVSRLAQLHAQAPEVVILPAHDRDQWVRAFGNQPSCH
ncbi:MBL fold metallo-hydrolase [Pendulispora rubella]|uniref:MBL fold metallo-hydrolase n=1 Tax=Pendulispora rubella TaxID=2741070 RepID=A0ABZ2LI59_9BACT